jgi:hypothetical protein
MKHQLQVPAEDLDEDSSDGESGPKSSEESDESEKSVAPQTHGIPSTSDCSMCVITACYTYYTLIPNIQNETQS